MSARSSASTSGSALQRSSSAGSSPASVAAWAIVSGSSSNQPEKFRTLSLRIRWRIRSGA